MIIPPLRTHCLDCWTPTRAHALKNTVRNNRVVYYRCPCGCRWTRFYKIDQSTKSRRKRILLQASLSQDENNYPSESIHQEGVDTTN